MLLALLLNIAALSPCVFPSVQSGNTSPLPPPAERFIRLTRSAQTYTINSVIYVVIEPIYVCFIV